MSIRAAHRMRLTERLAHWCGVGWLLVFGSAAFIAIHDEVVQPEEAANYLDLRTSVRFTAIFLIWVLVLNAWGYLLRRWWRDDLPPYLDWMLHYNVRVAVLWAFTQLLLALAGRVWWMPGYAWIPAHLSMAYMIGSSGALFGIPLLTTRRWRRLRAAVLAAD